VVRSVLVYGFLLQSAPYAVAQSNGHSTFLVFDPYDATLCGYFGLFVKVQARNYLFGTEEEKLTADDFSKLFREYKEQNEAKGDLLGGFWLDEFYEKAYNYLNENQDVLLPYVGDASEEMLGYMTMTHHITGEFVHPLSQLIERTEGACTSAYEMGQLQPLEVESPFNRVAELMENSDSYRIGKLGLRSYFDGKSIVDISGVSLLEWWWLSMQQDAEQNTPCKEIEDYNPLVSLKTNNGSKTSWEFFGFDGMAKITNVFAACDDKNPNGTNRKLSFTFDVLERNRFEQLGAEVGKFCSAGKLSDPGIFYDRSVSTMPIFRFIRDERGLLGVCEATLDYDGQRKQAYLSLYYPKAGNFTLVPGAQQ